MAWQAEHRDRCPGCGNPLTVTTDDDRRGEFRVESSSCAACELKASVLDQNRQDGGLPDGLIVAVVHDPTERPSP